MSNLTPFNGELDETTTLKPFDGTLDGEQPKPAGALRRLKQGISNTVDAARVAATNSPEEIAGIMGEADKNRIPASPAQVKMQEEIAPYVKRANEATGVVDNVLAWGSAAAKRAGQFIQNPSEFAGMVAENLPNSAPGMAGGLAGAAVGSSLGPVGTAVGGVVGGTAGGYAVEQGSSMQEQIQKEAQARGVSLQDKAGLTALISEKYPEFLEASRLKGIGTAGTDAVLNVATMGLAGAGERAIAKEARALGEAAKAGKIGATEAAQQLAEIEAKNAARSTLGATVKRGAGITGAEMLGEGASEAVGQKLGYGQVDAGDVIDESLLGLGTGVGMAASHKVVNKITGSREFDPASAEIKRASESITSVLPKADPVRDMVQQSADAGGPISAAALVGIDSGAHETQLQAALLDEKVQAASKDMPADVADAWAQYRAESAPLQQDQSEVFQGAAPAAPDWAAQAAEEERQQGPLQIQPKGMNMEQRKTNLAKLKERMLAGRSNGTSNAVQSLPTTSSGIDGNQQSASMGLGNADGNGLGADAGGYSAHPVVQSGEQSTAEPSVETTEKSKNLASIKEKVLAGRKTPQFQSNPQPTTLGTQTTAKAGPGFDASYLPQGTRNVSQAPQAVTSSPQQQEAGNQAPVGAATTTTQPGTAGGSDVQATGVEVSQPAQPAVNAGEGAGVSQPTQAAKLPPTDIRIGDKVLVNGKPHTVTQGVDGGVAVESDAKDLGSGVSNSQTRILKGDEAIKAKIAADDAGLNKQTRGVKPKKPSLKQRMEAERKARADYFTPGNIVKGYSGYDRVIDYKAPDEKGNGWSVTVQHVINQDGKWVVDPNDSRVRTHATHPDVKEMTKGPVYRAKPEKVRVQAAEDANPKASQESLGEQLAALNAELERQGSVQNANTRAKRDAIRQQIAGQDFPEILKAVDDNIDVAEDLNRAFQYAGDEPKAKTIERILTKRGITPEYQARWTERLLGEKQQTESSSTATVKVPQTVSDAIAAQMQKQKGRITRLRNEAKKAGSLEDKKAAQLKVTAAESTLRKMRTSVFDAEDAAVKAVESGNSKAFDQFADLFPGAAEEVAKLTGQNDELDAEMRSYEDKADKRKTAQEKYNALVPQWNDLAHRYKVADEQGKAIIQPAMDKLNAEMEALRRESLMDDKRTVFEQGQRQQAQREAEYGAMPVGQRLRPSEFAESKGLFWEKTGTDEWTGRGDWFQKDKTRTTAQMAEQGGYVAMAYKAEPEAKAALTEREKAAKAKMHNALGKLAALASKNTRMNWTAEEEQQLLPIVIELFDGAVELGAVTFQKAVAYVRDFIAQGIDQETADAIPFETLQGAYIAMSGRHKDKAITPRKEVVSFDNLEELQSSSPQETPAPAEVKQGEKNKSISSAKPSLNGPEGRHAVAQSVADYFIGGGKFDTIIQARKFISELTGEKIESSSKNAKLADETIEMGVVLAGREMVKAGRNQKRSDQTIYDRLVSLYNAQPNLSVRSSTSVEQQAYSTPIPLAFVASRLAKIKKGDIVAEPTAGNSALVLEVLPDHTVINELNDDRIGNLKAMGFTPTQKNAATEQLAAPSSVDAAVMNPPFGAVKDGEGKTIYFDVPASDNAPGLHTREIDHAIVFNSLATIKDDGRAVLIVGGVDASSEDQIRDGYRGKGKREFYYKLYNEYKVTDHFTVDGGLYSRQGAGYPVDVIVIDGRGKSARDLPAANLPQRIMSYDQLKEKLNEANTLVPTGSGTGVRVGSDPTGVSHGTDVATSSVGAPDGPGIAGAKPGQSIQTGSKGDGVRPILGQSAGSGSVSGGGKLGTSGTPTQPDGTVRGGLVAPAGVSGESGRKAGDGGNRSDDVGGNSSLDGKLVGSGLTDRRGQEAETENQVGYTPKSGKASVGTLVPVNMRDAIQESLSKVADDVGDLDDYVAKALGYTSQELGDYLSAEQIDALALAIYNAEQGKGFIIGDQTGIGKGRVNAAMIRYAIKKGQVPIFITEKPNLYADMIRDLDDIGMAKDLDLEGGKPHILMTNNGESIPYELYRNVNGEVVEHKLTLKAPKSNAKDAAALLAELAGNGELGRYKVIFSTYSQLQSIAGKATERQRFLTAFAKDNFIIFDESHNAGGTGEAQDSRAITKVMKAAGMTVPGRAGFARNLVKLAKGTFFSSATYAKRPDVMDLYSSTNMSLAVDKPADLATAIKAGGVPLQQAVATMLTADGQYIRRERTFAGVSYETQLMPIDRQTGENMAESMRLILAFSRAKEALLAQMQKEFDKDGAIAQNMGGEKTQVAGANFGSVMHNLIDQMLLALKVEESVKLAIAKLKSGEKVVLTVSNTMGSFLKDYADEMGIRPGDAVSLSFKDLYLRYLDKQRKYKVKSPGGTVEEKYLTDAELGHLLPMHNKIQAFIQNAGFGSAPISPIDYMHNELRKAGYKTDEITGRTVTVDYEGGIAKLASRTANIKQRLKAIGDFNSGAADVLILNQSGSTGLSLHASSKFKDQKKRHMIIVQAEKNIDTHMQMLGRVHRTGQVVTPGYTQAMADTPAEMRPAAVLSKKMAGLSANTTASRKSAVAAEGVVDFINEYGGQVAAEFLQDNPEVHDALGGQKRIEVPSDLNEAGEDLIRKLTGYIPILPLKQQEQIYADLIERYNDLIARENSMGTNRLETKALDLDAKTLTSEKITANKGSATETSVFAEPANMEQVDVKRNVKPLTPQELEAAINETLNGLTPQQYNTNIAKEFDSDLAKYVADVLEKMAVTTDNHALVQGQKKDQLFLMGQNIKRVLSIYKVGDSVTITDKNASVVHGVITGITHNQKTKNPAAGSAWKMTFALANGDARTMSVGFGQLGQQFSVNVTPGTVPQVTADGKVDRVMIRSLFENGNNIRREKRWMVTGNLLAGFSKYQGQIVSYTKADGGTGQGVLMNRQFDYKKEKGASTLSFSTSAQAIEFLTKAGRNAVLGSPDRVLRIVSLGNDRYSVMVPSSKREGGSLYLDRGLLDAFGADFYKQGQNMSMRIDGNDTLVRGLNYLIAERDDISLAALSNQDVARKILGMDDNTAAFSRVKFSRTAQGQANGTVEQTVADIVKGWATRPKIVVAFDMNDERIPERVRMEDQKQRSGGASGAPEGFYYKGTVYLMSSKLATPEDVARVLFHEALGHHGLRSVFGKKLNSILNRIAMARKSEVDAKMAQYGLKGISKVDRLTAAEEILAEMAQTKPNIGFVREAIAAIRTWLRDHIPGFKNLALTDDEIIRSYIVPARNFVERGGTQSFGMFAPSMARDAGPRESDVSPIGFYSALARGIEASTANVAPPMGWKATIKGLVNKGLAKADEVEWSGVNEWLDMQGGKVAKTQVLDFLRGNGVQVQEVTLSGNKHYRDANGNRVFDDATGDYVAAHNPAKYENYTLPGGTNYREVLLTFPGEYSVGAKIATLRAREVAQKMRFAETDEEYELLRKERAELAEKSKGGLVYKSSHWDQPNVLAHIRVNDRVDATGAKTLLIEELQSDFAQDYRKSKEAINKAVDDDFTGIIERMKKAGLVEVNCD